MSKPFRIATRVLSASFARLGEEVDNVLAAGADIVHFDAMDNHCVPNLTIGPLVYKAVKQHGVTAPIHPRSGEDRRRHFCRRPACADFSS